MNREELKASFLRGFSGFLSLSLVVVVYMVLQNLTKIVGVLGMVRNIMMPFLFGCVIAYILKIPCAAIERRFLPKIKNLKLRRVAKAAVVPVVVALAIASVYILVALVVPELVRSINSIINALPSAADRLLSWLNTFFADSPETRSTLSGVIASMELQLQSWTRTILLPMMQSMLGGFANAFTAVAGTMYNIFIGLIVCIYLLLSRKRLARHCKAVVYAFFRNERADKIMKEMAFVDHTFAGFFGGKLLDSVIMGILCYFFCFILDQIVGFPNAVLISIIIGVTNFVPTVGPIVGAIISALLVLINSPTNCLIFLIFILVLQQIDGNIIGPRILSESIGLPGLWVLFSVTLFGGLFGLVGIVAGVPAFAVVYDALRQSILKRLRRKGRMDILRPKNTD